MTSIKKYENERRKLNENCALIDRGLDTAARFDTLEEFRRTCNSQLSEDSLMGFRTRMDLLIFQYMSRREEDRRRADLCDLVVMESLNEAEFQKDVKLLILPLRQGKVPYPS